jgi:short-subunit dehydrogenase
LAARACPLAIPRAPRVADSARAQVNPGFVTSEMSTGAAFLDKEGRAQAGAPVRRAPAFFMSAEACAAAIVRATGTRALRLVVPGWYAPLLTIYALLPIPFEWAATAAAAAFAPRRPKHE